jgi:hypothetical protein
LCDGSGATTTNVERNTHVLMDEREVDYVRLLA